MDREARCVAATGAPVSQARLEHQPGGLGIVDIVDAIRVDHELDFRPDELPRKFSNVPDLELAKGLGVVHQY